MHMRPGQAISAIDSAFILMALQSEIHYMQSPRGIHILDGKFASQHGCYFNDQSFPKFVAGC